MVRDAILSARLVLKEKIVTSEGAIIEAVVWKLPRPLPGSPHPFKYRLYYGAIDGSCLVRYDNERGKGDHRHIHDNEESYPFESIEKLLEDFAADINREGSGR